MIPLQQTGELSEAIQIALNTVLDPMNLVIILLAAVLGLLLGILPGVGGPIGIALLIPITFEMEPNIAIMIMVATLGGTAFGGSVTAILLNTPGDAPNAATLLDGYPMARQGRGGEAIAASAVSSAGGALLGIGLFLITIPFIREISLAFGPPQIFWLAIIGLATIAVVTRGSVLTDLIAGAFGLMLAFHGLNSVTGTARFNWGTTYLFDGFPLIPLIIGLFAIAEIIKLTSRGSTISKAEIAKGGRMKGVRSTAKNWGLFLRSSVLGWFIGVIPGAGGTVANFLAYIQAEQSSSNSESFGKGDVRGVIASESANDAKDGGSMVPTLGLGIPGSASTAVLLGAFVIHGITPGPLLFQENLQIVFIVVFALLISNVVTSFVGILTANQFVKVTRIPITTVAPVMLAIALIGAFAVRSSLMDLGVAVGFGIFGYLMIKYGMSRVAIVIALVLGPIAEANFHRALQISRGDYAAFYNEPLSLGLIVVGIVILSYPIYTAVSNQ
ncbi:putative tricarboxylic transport membrane protein [Halopenitus malekzadehii]|uniref:Putative tricarboxylic transport membrane protein n=2 Tax=Halopenitus malekzadehii TaxID=1267564 RepID=A0A1H6JP05_9EURY|nr:putative tricarboxylic transport membrane protein [Halopenitus malekzadehii]